MADKPRKQSAQQAAEAMAISDAIFELLHSTQVPPQEGLVAIANALGVACAEALKIGAVDVKAVMELYEVSKVIMLERLKSYETK